MVNARGATRGFFPLNEPRTESSINSIIISTKFCIPVGASVLSPGPIATDLMTRSISGDEADLQEGHEMLNQGMDADKVGKLTLDAIAAGRFWIFTHPAIFKTIRTRMEHALTDGALPPEIDWDWEELFATS